MTNATHAPAAEPGFARFDWYTATIDDSPAEVERTLAAGLGGDVVASTPLHGYAHARQFRDRESGEVRATLLYGGGHEKPHAFASGKNAIAFSELVRAVWPSAPAPGAVPWPRPADSRGGHYVTRFDTAIDYDEPGAFSRLYDVAVGLAKQKSLRLGTAGDWITPESEFGRTLYVGSPSSPVQVRLYEKGKQLRAELSDPDLIAATSPHWVRIEARVRPTRDARYRAATTTPEEGWGYALWTRDLLDRLEGVEVQRVALDAIRERDDDRALNFMVRQYGKALARLAADVGGWAAVGVALRERAHNLGVDTSAGD